MNVKRFVFNCLTLPLVNQVASSLVKLVELKLPFIMPVVGRMVLKFNSEQSFVMSSNGQDSIASRIYFNGFRGFEHESLMLFNCLIGLDSVSNVLDIGANTGVYSLLAASHPTTPIVNAFEPMPDIHGRLQANVVANSFTNIVTHAAALSDQNGEIDFFYRPAITVPTGGSAAKGSWAGVEKITVQTITLDQLIENGSVTSLDLIKIDTEMTEPLVLKGGIVSISHFKPYIICEVLDEVSSSSLGEILSPLGYRFFHIKKEVIEEHASIKHDLTYECANFLFVPNQRMLEFRHIFVDQKRHFNLKELENE